MSTSPDREKLLAALASTRAAGVLTRTQIYSNVFGRHRSSDAIDELLYGLAQEGVVLLETIPPQDGTKKPTEMIRLNALGANECGLGAEQPPARPVGQGWLRKADILAKARRGVMPAHAARVGKRVRREESKRKTGRSTPTGITRVSDETRGATHLVRSAFKNYVDQGVIEVDGEWIRLAKNPPRRPPHHWHEALLHFLAEGHPSLDGKYRRKPPRTLRSVMEDALGRVLEPDELVRRKPGCAGSWSPYDIVLLRAVATLEEVRQTQ